MTTPVDDALLEPLGRVQRAAVRLHRCVRDAVNQLTGQPGDIPLDAGLSEAVRDLESRVGWFPTGDQRTALLSWIHEQVMPAADRRTRVTRARVVVAENGRQALRDDATGEEFDADDVLEVADQLYWASRTLPPPPDGA